MALLCSSCGKTLPRDDARFCNECGAPLRSVPPSAHNSADLSPSRPPNASTSTPLREQIAQQPFSRPNSEQSANATNHSSEIGRSRNTSSSQSPSSIHPEAIAEGHDQGPRPRNSSLNRSSRAKPTIDGKGDAQLNVSIDWPQPITHVSVNESPKQQTEQPLSQNSHNGEVNTLVEPTVVPETPSSLDELPTNILVPVAQPNDDPQNPPRPTEEDVEQDDDVKHLPGAPVTALPSSEELSPVEPTSVSAIADSPTSIMASTIKPQDVEDVQTQLLPAEQKRPIPSAQPVYQGAAPPEQADLATFSPPPSVSSSPAALATNSVEDSNQVQASVQPLDSALAVPVTGNAPQPIAARHPGSSSYGQNLYEVSSPRARLPRLALLGLLAFLLLVGVGGWIVLARPFSVADVTRPDQPYSNARLGFALHYPTEWTVHENRGKSTVAFTDSSQTDELNVAVIDGGKGDVKQYLQQQASSAGMTNTQDSTTLFFAGSTWQQVQGSVQVQGANYTQTLLGTMHGNRLYVLTQRAPQDTYKDEERLVFAPLRTSWQWS